MRSARGMVMGIRLELSQGVYVCKVMNGPVQFVPVNAADEDSYQNSAQKGMRKEGASPDWSRHKQNLIDYS